MEIGPFRLCPWGLVFVKSTLITVEDSTHGQATSGPKASLAFGYTLTKQRKVRVPLLTNPSHAQPQANHSGFLPCELYPLYLDSGQVLLPWIFRDISRIWVAFPIDRGVAGHNPTMLHFCQFMRPRGRGNFSTFLDFGWILLPWILRGISRSRRGSVSIFIFDESGPTTRSNEVVPTVIRRF